jgi:hypothetical protein
MQRPAEATTSPVLNYSTLRRRWPWKPYILGVVTAPTVYLLLYAILRVTGVFHAYYSQGSWEIEGGTGIQIVDVPCIPLTITEGKLQNRLRWLPEPTGG